MTHLDPRSLRALLDGSLPAGDAAAIGAHLQTPCDRCATVAGDVPLDLLARLLAAESAPAVAPPAAAQVAMFSRATASAPAPRRVWRPWAVGLALAAAAVIGVRIGLPESGGPVDPYALGGGVKGDAVVPSIQLRSAAGRAGASGLSLERRLAEGDTVAASETLLFELECDGTGARYLFVRDGAGAVQQLFPALGSPARVEPSGPRPPEIDGNLVGLDVSDMTGPLTLIAAVSARPLDPQAAVLQPWLSVGAADGVRFAVVSLEVGR